MTAPRERGGGRIAVVAPNWLGDAVMSLPAIARAAAAAPVSVLAAPYTARVFWKAPGVDEVWVDPPGGRLGRIRARAGELRRAGASAALVLPPSFSGALPPWLAGVPVRVGYRLDGRGALLTDAPAAPPRSLHLSESYSRLAERIDGAARAVPDRPRLHVADAERKAVRDRLAREGVTGPYAVVVPGAAFGPAKSWPEDRYRSLCERLSRDVAVVVTGADADRGICARVAGGRSGVVSFAGATSLGEFFALAEGAQVLVANDSGAPHVSAAVGTPTVVLFGSTSPQWTAPLGDAVAVLQHVVHCNPCFRRTCPTQLECFHGIPVDEVEGRVRAFLSSPRPQKPFASRETLG